jgi:hypothetical protein
MVLVINAKEHEYIVGRMISRRLERRSATSASEYNKK